MSFYRGRGRPVVLRCDVRMSVSTDLSELWRRIALTKVDPIRSYKCCMCTALVFYVVDRRDGLARGHGELGDLLNEKLRV